MGRELYLIARGEVEVLDDVGNVIKVLKDGDIFGEMGLLMSTPRTANVRARTSCDLFVLDKADFSRILRDSPQFAQAAKAARSGSTCRRGADAAPIGVARGCRGCASSSCWTAALANGSGARARAQPEQRREDG